MPNELTFCGEYKLLVSSDGLLMLFHRRLWAGHDEPYYIPTQWRSLLAYI